MAIPSIIYLDVLNSQYAEIGPITDGISGSEYTTATVTATLVDTNNVNGGGAGTTITGFPITLTYNSTDHVYRGALPDGFNPKTGLYSMIFDADQSGVKLKITINAYVQGRTN